MTNPGPTKEEYGSLIYKLTTLGAKAAVVTMVVALLSSGCASTLSEIRTKEPCQTLTSTKTPQELSKCIEFKLRAELGGGLIVNREEYPDNVYRIALHQAHDGSTPFGGVASSALTDILVKLRDSGAVVEVRKWDWSSATFQSKILEMIERCAK